MVDLRSQPRLIEKIIAEFPDLGEARARRLVEILIEHLQERERRARRRIEQEAIDQELA